MRTVLDSLESECTWFNLQNTLASAVTKQQSYHPITQENRVARYITNTPSLLSWRRISEAMMGTEDEENDTIPHQAKSALSEKAKSVKSRLSNRSDSVKPTKVTLISLYHAWSVKNFVTTDNPFNISFQQVKVKEADLEAGISPDIGFTPKNGMGDEAMIL